jgi:hypothetical protein
MGMGYSDKRKFQYFCQQNSVFDNTFERNGKALAYATVSKSVVIYTKYSTIFQVEYIILPREISAMAIYC